MGKDSKKSNKKPEYWLKWKNIEKEMKKIIKTNKKIFPNLQELRRLDYENQDIEKAIMRHGLTLDEVRLKMGYKTTESASRDKMLELLEASTESFLSNVRDIKKERQEIFQNRRVQESEPEDKEVVLEVVKPQAQPQPQFQPQPQNPQVNYSEPPQDSHEDKPKNIKDKLKAFEEQLKKYEV